MQPEKQASSKGSTIGLALLFGVVGASLSSDVEGFLFGAMFGALLAQVLHLRGRTRSLEDQLQALQRAPKAAAPEQPAAAVASRAEEIVAARAPPVTIESKT